MNTENSFGQIILHLRNERKLSQKYVADSIEVAQPTYALYEADKREPGFETLKKIARFFDVTTDYMLGLEDSRTHDGQAVFDKLGLSDEAINVLSGNDSLEFEETDNRDERLHNIIESDMHIFYANFVNVLTSHDTKDFVLAFQVLTDAIDEAQCDRSSAAVRREVFPDASEDELDIIDNMRYDERIGYFAYQSNKHFMKFLDDLQRESYRINKGGN